MPTYVENALPANPVKTAIYFIKNGSTVKMYVTDASGNPYLINPSVPEHNLLTGLQGGEAGQYYHLTQSQYTQLTSQLTGLISIDNIIQGNGEVTLEGVLWVIVGVQFYVASQTFPITPATDGFYRTDIITGNSSGVLTYIEGVESISNPVTPTTPVGEVLITRINIFGDTIEIPVDPPTIPTAQQVFEQGRTVYLIGGSPISLLHESGGRLASLTIDGGGTTQLAGDQVQIFGTNSLDLSLGTSDTVPTTNSGTWNLATNVNGLFANTSGTIDITSLIPLPQGLQSVLDTGETAESNDGLSVITLQPNYFIDGGTQNPFIYFKMSNDDESLYTEYSQNHDGLNIYRYNNITGLQEFIDFDQFNPMIYMEATDAINGGGSNLGIHQVDGVYFGYSNGSTINNQMVITPTGMTLEAGTTDIIINPLTPAGFKGIQYAFDNSANYTPLSLITKQDLDVAIAASFRPAGNWDASVGTFPTTGTGTGGAVRSGDVYRVSVAGTIAGEIYDVGDTFYAIVSSPGQTASNWGKFEVNTAQATASYRGTMFLYPSVGANTNGTITQAGITVLDNANIKQGGNSFGAPVIIGSNDVQNVSIERNNVVRATFTASTLDLAEGTTIQNATVGARGMFNIGAAGSSPFIARNTADAIDALQIVNQNNTSTGNIVTFWSNIGSLAQRAGVRKDGRGFGADATISNDWITLGQLPALTVGHIRLGSDTIQTPVKVSFMTEAQYAAITPDSGTTYFIEEAVPTKIVNIVTNSSTYGLTYVGKVIYITFNGTTSTLTLPPITGGEMVKITIINEGSGAVTVNTNTGANDISDGGSLVNNIVLGSGNRVAIYNNSIKFITPII